MRRDVILALAIGSTALLACRPIPSAVTALRGHAAQRNRCPGDDVVVTSLATNVYRVHACGDVGTYSCVRHYGERYTQGYVDECVRVE